MQPTPEMPTPNVLSWRGAMARIKPDIAPYWLEVYAFLGTDNPLSMFQH